MKGERFTYLHRLRTNSSASIAGGGGGGGLSESVGGESISLDVPSPSVEFFAGHSSRSCTWISLFAFTTSAPSVFCLREKGLKTWADGVIADCCSSEEDLVLVGCSSFSAFSAQFQLQVEEFSKRVELSSAEHFALRALAVKKLVALRRAQTDALDLPSVKVRRAPARLRDICRALANAMASTCLEASGSPAGGAPPDSIDDAEKDSAEASLSTSPSTSPAEGDRVSYLVKGVVATGVVVKRQGMRLRVSGDAGITVWIEINQVTAILKPSLSPPNIGSAAELSASSIAVVLNVVMSCTTHNKLTPFFDFRLLYPR